MPLEQASKPVEELSDRELLLKIAFHIGVLNDAHLRDRADFERIADDMIELHRTDAARAQTELRTARDVRQLHREVKIATILGPLLVQGTRLIVERWSELVAFAAVFARHIS